MMRYIYHFHAEWENDDESLGRTHGLVSTNYRVSTDEAYKRLFDQIMMGGADKGASRSNFSLTSLSLLHTTSEHPPHG